MLLSHSIDKLEGHMINSNTYNITFTWIFHIALIIEVFKVAIFHVNA